MNEARADVVVGIQFGDEGKGRIVDWYAKDYDIVARFGGGDNAGHSIEVGSEKLALRIVPSGVMHGCELFIGGGTVVSLEGLIGELDGLAARGIDISRIRISDRAHVVFPYHAQADREAEAARGSRAIGTTGRGIGPAYVDRVARTGVTFRDLLDDSAVREKLSHRGANDAIEATLDRARRIRSHVVDGVAYIHTALEQKRKILIEGAQGSLLDVGYGTYPFVTSSHTIAGGACTGLGIGPRAIGRVVGVVKAYTTRVGSGPFPSELHGEDAERLRAAGKEFGVVTGRPRRCGWFDAVAGRYAVQLNGLSSAVLTKLDVLSGFERIGVVTGYRRGGGAATFAHAGDADLETTVEWLHGWSDDLRRVRRIRDLPREALTYVRRLESLLGVPFEAVSVGPERSQLAL